MHIDAFYFLDLLVVGSNNPFGLYQNKVSVSVKVVLRRW